MILSRSARVRSGVLCASLLLVLGCNKDKTADPNNCRPCGGFSKGVEYEGTYILGGDANWYCQSSVTDVDCDAVRSGDISDGQTSWFEKYWFCEGTMWFSVYTD